MINKMFEYYHKQSMNCYSPCLIGVHVAFPRAEMEGKEFRMFRERKKERSEVFW